MIYIYICRCTWWNDNTIVMKACAEWILKTTLGVQFIFIFHIAVFSYFIFPYKLYFPSPNHILRVNSIKSLEAEVSFLSNWKLWILSPEQASKYSIFLICPSCMNKLTNLGRYESYRLLGKIRKLHVSWNTNDLKNPLEQESYWQQWSSPPRTPSHVLYIGSPWICLQNQYFFCICNCFCLCFCIWMLRLVLS